MFNFKLSLDVLSSGNTKKQLLLVQPTSNGRFTVIPQEQEGEGLIRTHWLGFWPTTKRMNCRSSNPWVHLSILANMGRHPRPLHLQPHGHLQRRRPKGFAKTTNVSSSSKLQSQLLEAMKCAYLIVLMATYWMTEAMPLPITSMIPMVTRFQHVIY